jgi:hypothetical protein
MLNKITFFSLILFFTAIINYGQVDTSEVGIRKEQAIKLAEQFIVDNGYTNLPANKSNISYELFDESSIDKLLKQRYNTLQSKASYISYDEDAWHIGFVGSNVNLKKLKKNTKDIPGRSVIVRKDGKEIRISHKAPLFSKFIKL